MKKKLAFVSDLDGHIINFNAPFILFKKKNNLSAFFSFDEKGQENLIIKKDSEHDCYLNPYNSSYTDENLFLIMKDNQLEFWGDRQEKSCDNLETILRHINILELGGYISVENFLINYGFMSIYNFNKALKNPGQVSDRLTLEKNGKIKEIYICTEVPNFDKFYYLNSLIEIEKIIQNTNIHIKNTDIEDNFFCYLQANIHIFIQTPTCFSKTSKNFSFMISEILKKTEYPNSSKIESNEDLLELLRQRLISIAIRDKNILERTLYVPFLESKHVPFGSRLVPIEAAKNRHIIYENLYKNTPVKVNDHKSHINQEALKITKEINSLFTEQYLA